MERKKIHLEYLLNATSKSILWAAISTPTGLEGWFADRVQSDCLLYTSRTSPASGLLLSKKGHFNSIILLQAFKADEYPVLVIGSQVLKPPALWRITEYDFSGLHRREIL